MTAINYGKRDAGDLTAASPGDTLYIPLSFYNDSGASISIGNTLAVTDVEVFKNGSAVQRATDSGYAVLGDTGNFDSRTGFKGISIQLFNTADDTGFYDAGSSYWVAIDNVTVDGRTVRFFPAVFEIGLPQVNVAQIDGDTGSADVLAKATNAVGGVSFSAGIFVDTLSTGAVDQLVDGVWDEADTGHADTGTYGRLRYGVNAGKIAGDTGAAAHIARMSDEYDTGRIAAEATATLDTGAVNQAVWAADASRTLTEWSFDTGIQQAIQRMDTGMSETIDRILADTDTGIQPPTAAEIAIAVWDNESDTGHGVNVVYIAGDTGAATHIAQLSDEYDTGRIAAEATITAFADTGVNDRLATIQAKTDSLTFTVAGQADANVQSVNDVTVTGTGSSGDEWGP